VYVKIDRVRSGKKVYSYLTLAESYRNESGQPRHRIVARLGEVSELKSSGELERIVEALSVQLGRGAEHRAQRRVRSLLWSDGRL
jgi:hypothetical protein